MMRRDPSVLLATLLVLGAGAMRASAAVLIENRGQWAPQIRYGGNAAGLTVFCLDEGLVLALGEGRSRHALRLVFVGGTPSHPEPRGVGAPEWSFLHGDDPACWLTGVPSCSEVVYRRAWPGIDLAFSVRDGILAYRIDPVAGVDPGIVAFEYRGGDGTRLGGDRTIRVSTSAGTLIDRRDDPRFGTIETEGADPRSAPTPDDPTALRWSTFVGGSFEDYGYAVASRPSGNVVIAGTTRSIDFPASIGAFADTSGGSYDIFAAEIDPTGSALLWCTYIGGTGADLAHAMILDDEGDVVLTGKTESPDFPVTGGGFDTLLGGTADAYALALDPTGSRLLWSTYLGGLDYEIAFGLLRDPLGRIVVAGYTMSPDYPVTADAWDRTYNGGFDIFVTVLSPTGHSLEWSTFLGGTNDERTYHIAPDADGGILLTGWTQSPDYPVTRGAYDETYNGGSDAIVSKLSGAGSLVWSTFLGGSDIERAYAVGTDGGGNPVIAGYVRSPDFPTTAEAYDRTYGGNGDGFVTTLDRSGSALVWSTFLGGTDEDRCHDLLFDAAMNPIVTGSTASADFPATPGAYDGSYAGGGDAFGAMLDPSGRALLWGSFLGGGGWDMGNAAVPSDGGSIVICGETDSPDFPTTAGASDETPNGVADVFVAKVTIRSVSGAPHPPVEWGERILTAGPNPFGAFTNLRLDLPRSAGVSLRVFDGGGSLVRTLLESGGAMPGPRAIEWDGRDDAGRPVPSGYYVARLSAGPMRRSVSLIRIR